MILMEQELNIYLMVECWIRDYIDINDMYIRMVEDGQRNTRMGIFSSEVNYHIVVYFGYVAIINLDIKISCIDYLYARF